jgi:hypothetical protein
VQLQLGKLREAQMMLEDCLKSNPDCAEAQKDLEVVKLVRFPFFFVADFFLLRRGAYFFFLRL